MWSRIFAGLIVFSSIATGSFVYYASSWLNSIGSPRDAFEGFLYHSAMAQGVLWATILILGIAANIVLWVSGRSWALWTTLLYLAVFVFARYGWLDHEGLAFAEKYGLPGDGLKWGFMTALLTTAASAAVIYLDVFVVTRLRHRLQPPEPLVDASEVGNPAEQPSPDE